MKKKQAVIEFIDSEEFNTSMISPFPKPLIDKDINYTHLELHPSLVFGSSAFMLPFIQHNQAARNILALAQSKKTVCSYSNNFKNRFDTSGHVLNYPEKPLCLNRMSQYINTDKVGTGQNIIVAITAYNGYNQEDAIIGNQRSLDLGLYNSSLFREYYSFEAVDKNIGTEDKFYNPTDFSVLDNEDKEELIKIARDNLNYNKLDDLGIIKEGTYVNDRDTVLIGKYVKTKDDAGNKMFKDISFTPKPDHIKSVVDKVYTTQMNVNLDRLTKIRLCQYRNPEIGDKFASRCGQKGTFGLVMKPEDLPYTEDGMIPDMILNPYGYPKRMTCAQFLEYDS